MRDQQERAIESAKIFFQPLDGFIIKMVGRLIKN
ncbi:Uncharacterised protein [Mycobacteroides abscessus subsp. abscessus]|nr:Uncharacterised protein [Mycobacteroides abscessus subsp. abscessus]